MKKFTADQVVKIMIVFTVIIFLTIVALLIWHGIELKGIRGHL